MPFNELKQDHPVENKITNATLTVLQLHEIESNDGQQYTAQLQNFQLYNFQMPWSTFQEQRSRYHIQEQPQL